MYKNFGPDSPYDGNSSFSKLYRKNMSKSEKSSYPIHGKWSNYLIHRFTECYSKGKAVTDLTEEDANVDPDNLVRNIPLIVLLAGDPSLMTTLSDSILQLQTNDMIVAVILMLARLIERYILDGSLPDSTSDASRLHPVERVVEDLKRPDRELVDPLDRAMVNHLNEVLGKRGRDHKNASMEFGIS